MRAIAVAVAATLMVARQTPAAQPDSTGYPFKVGERFQYAAKLGILRLGTAWMSVNGIDTVRGSQSFVFEFGLDASAPFYKSTNVMRSWTGTEDLISRRFHQDLVENGKQRKRYYEIFPDSQSFTQEQKPGSKPSVESPLDDAAFFYFLRTIPLEVGKTYSFDRYFRKELNPVVIKVVKREDMKMPDGSKVSCLVLNPVVGEDGVFAPRAEALLWLTNDAQRVPVQIRSKLPFGTVTLQIEKIEQKADGQ
ncbi:MAG TPA: DUF3108 domain-containing protein [Gemmatimonadales bacterium]|nr:DUF3108 domain-containing protein [Gemmatimonadales bacterium]